MKIAGSTVQLHSRHAAVTRREARESLRMWIGDRRSAFESPDQPASLARLQTDSVRLSQACNVHCCKQLAPADVEPQPGDESKLKLGWAKSAIPVSLSRKMARRGPSSKSIWPSECIRRFRKRNFGSD